MADLTTAPPDPCCAAERPATCCEPSEEAACCDTSAAGGGCGCAAGTDAGPAVRERVRDRYAAAAHAVAAGSAEGCACGPVSTVDADGEQVFGAALYGDDASAAGVAGTALAGSLGCGVPTAVADLHPGETVLDLGDRKSVV